VNTPPIPKVQDQATQRALDAIAQSLAILSKNVVYTSTTITVPVTSTPTIFFHTLKNTPQGFLVIDRNADVRVWRTAWDAQSITLQANTSATVTILLF
jgi:hypothetical protein